MIKVLRVKLLHLWSHLLVHSCRNSLNLQADSWHTEIQHCRLLQVGSNATTSGNGKATSNPDPAGHTEGKPTGSPFPLTCQVDGPPSDPIRERPEDDIPHQQPGEEQRPGQADLIGLLSDEDPLRRTGTGGNPLKPQCFTSCLWMFGFPDLRDDGVHILREDDVLLQLPVAGRTTVLLLDPILWCVSDQNDQHGLAGHVDLKHRKPEHTPTTRRFKDKQQKQCLPLSSVRGFIRLIATLTAHCINIIPTEPVFFQNFMLFNLRHWALIQTVLRLLHDSDLLDWN